jgi:NAD(P)-dependent dehydrogenase (short-subunit alcohol dehydrogenase family)
VRIVSLEGKVVVVTGSSRGIGRAIANACAAHGAHVVVSSRTQPAVDEAVAGIESMGGSAAGLAADVADPEQVQHLFDFALSTRGRLDVWVNNAGITEGYRPMDELAPEELAEIVSVNLLGHMYGARVALKHFRSTGRGYLMNMAGRGWKGEATSHTAAYAATKTAIASLTRSLAAENKDVAGISVNAIVPGMVDTDFYRDIRISERLERSKDNWRYALDAFGVPLTEVGEKTAALLGAEPGAKTGEIFSFIGGGQMVTGIAKMAYWGMTGKLGKEPGR